MVSATLLFGFRRSLAPDQRLGMALLASALLHALMLMSLPKYSVHGNVFTRPVFAPLSVRLEKLPESAEAKPMLINKKKASLHQKPNASMPVAPSVPAEVEPSEPSLSQPGVSVSDSSYLQPIPSRASSPLLATGEFHRSSDLNEKTETIRMRIPEYPRAAREQNLSGWIIVMLLVDEQGKAVETAAVESSEAFNDYEKEVAEEMRDSTFTAGKLDGRAVKTLVFVTVRFDSKGLSGLETATGITAPVSGAERKDAERSN